MVSTNPIVNTKREILNSLQKQFLEMYKEYYDITKEIIIIFNNYNFVFGKISIHRYELYTLSMRINRKIQLYQNEITQNKIIEEEIIEQKLDNEFLEKKNALSKMQIEYEDAVRFVNRKALPDAEICKMNQIFIKIINQIHPNLYLTLPDDILKLFSKTLDAYLSNNIEEISLCEHDLIKFKDRIITLQDEYEINIEELECKINRLQDLIKEYQNKINQSVNSFPYNQKDILSNPTLVNERMMEIEKDINFLYDNIKRMEFILEKLNPIYEKNLC